MANRKKSAPVEYDYEAAGATLDGVFLPVYAAFDDLDGWFGAAHRGLKRECLKVLQDDDPEVVPDIGTEAGRGIWAARTARSFLKLSRQAFKAGQLDDARGFLIRAMTCWFVLRSQMPGHFIAANELRKAVRELREADTITRAWEIWNSAPYPKNKSAVVKRLGKECKDGKCIHGNERTRWKRLKPIQFPKR